jgi:hypothetical protein
MSTHKCRYQVRVTDPEGVVVFDSTFPTLASVAQALGYSPGHISSLFARKSTFELKDRRESGVYITTFSRIPRFQF